MSTRAASGTQFVLVHADQVATIASVGASLRRFIADGRDLVLPFDADEVRPAYRGAVLAPWPNRVAGGRWAWRGIDHQLPVTEPGRGHALHGLVLWADWAAPRHTDASVSLTTAIAPQDGYPFWLDLTMTWSLDADGLRAELSATNVGDDHAPYGCGIHPYLVAPTGGLDDWILHLPAAERLDVDGTLIPTGRAAVDTGHDFRTPRRIGDAVIDHAFTALIAPEGSPAITLSDRRGAGVRMRFDPALRWVQVCTSDWPDRPGHRAALAVEPMSCPPNAFAGHDDLVVLAPGRTHTTWWRIEPVRQNSSSV